MDRMEMMHACVTKARDCIELIEEVHNVKLATPRINFDLRGTTAGMAYPGANTIRLNATLCSENFEHFIAQTVPHEVAHIAAPKVFKRYRVKSHGNEWRQIMRTLGVPAYRCHNYDVSNSQTFTKQKYEVKCPCRIHHVTATVVRRMRMGTKYTCRKCKGELTF